MTIANRLQCFTHLASSKDTTIVTCLLHFFTLHSHALHQYQDLLLGHWAFSGHWKIGDSVMSHDSWCYHDSCKSGVGVPVSSAGDRTKSARRSWFKASWASFSATCVLSSITASMDGRLVIGWIQWKYGKSMKLAYYKCSKPWAGGLRSGCHCIVLDDFSSDHSIGCWMMCHTLNPMAWRT